MKLKRHKVEGVPFQQARWIGHKITPEVVILHDTASAIEAGSAAAYLKDNARKVSVHFVVERDGSIVQQVPTNRQANHAGRSHYHGRDHVNGFSIGIEIVNPGRMEDVGGGFARTWFGQSFRIAQREGVAAAAVGELVDIRRAYTKENGDGLWMSYTPEQIIATMTLLSVLFDGIPTLRDVRTHWYVSPGRKIDTNPLFPLDQVRSAALGREEPSEDDADERSEEAVDDTGGAGFQATIRIGGEDGLNMRRWPSFNPNVIAQIPEGITVPVLRDGWFGEGAHRQHWLKVAYAGQHGWIASPYTDWED